MKQFKNIETNLISKWYGEKIDVLIHQNEDKEMKELQCLVSETIELLIKEELKHVSESFVSELIGESFDNINYEELIRYYKD